LQAKIVAVTMTKLYMEYHDSICQRTFDFEKKLNQKLLCSTWPKSL